MDTSRMELINSINLVYAWIYLPWTDVSDTTFWVILTHWFKTIEKQSFFRCIFTTKVFYILYIFNW